MFFFKMVLSDSCFPRIFPQKNNCTQNMNRHNTAKPCVTNELKNTLSFAPLKKARYYWRAQTIDKPRHFFGGVFLFVFRSGFNCG